MTPEVYEHQHESAHLFEINTELRNEDGLVAWK
jgi:hypothetical protein